MQQSHTPKPVVGFVCFGEVNTPIERLHLKHDEALQALAATDAELIDGGLVIDDPAYETADAAIAKLREKEFSSLIAVSYTHLDVYKRQA